MELRQKYSEIEKRIHPIIDFLEENKNTSIYRKFYKGIITLQSPLIYKPEILFVGINSGDGAYTVLNNKDKIKNVTPLRMLGHDERCFEELNWYEKGNSRICPYQWYHRNKKVNNSFPKNMINLLYETAKLRFPEEYSHQKYNNEREPFWYNGFGQKIMATNLYPIATKYLSDLNRIHDELSREESLQEFWEEIRHEGESIGNWVVRRYFIRRFEELVNLVQPKVIVCLGMTALNDFTFLRHKGKGEKIFVHSKKVGDQNFPVIGFSRKGQWSVLISEIAKKIVEIIIKR